MAVARRVQDLDYPITKEWLQAVREALGDERGAQARLAKEIGCAPSTLTELLKEGKRSHLVPKISRALGIPMPLIMSRDTHELQVMLDLLRKKDPDAYETMRAYASAMTSDDTSDEMLVAMAQLLLQKLRGTKRPE